MTHKPASAAEVRERITTRTYELNALLRVAASFGVVVTVDTIDRDGHTVIVTNIPYADGEE